MEQPAIKSANKRTYHMRRLPAPAISFSSDEGRALFTESVLAGTANGFFKLMEQFATQDEPAYCGLATLATTLNALGIDPRQVWRGAWRWFGEAQLNCCVPLEVAKKDGTTLSQIACIARCNGAHVDLHRANKLTLESLRTILQDCCSGGHAHVVVSYCRKVLNQSGCGHFSPIGAYHAGQDMALILDVARFKYPPHWVPVEALLAAMAERDPVTGHARGLLRIRAQQLRESSLFAVDVAGVEQQIQHHCMAGTDELLPAVPASCRHAAVTTTATGASDFLLPNNGFQEDSALVEDLNLEGGSTLGGSQSVGAETFGDSTPAGSQIGVQAPWMSAYTFATETAPLLCRALLARSIASDGSTSLSLQAVVQELVMAAPLHSLDALLLQRKVIHTDNSACTNGSASGMGRLPEASSSVPVQGSAPTSVLTCSLQAEGAGTAATAVGIEIANCSGAEAQQAEAGTCSVPSCQALAGPGQTEGERGSSATPNAQSTAAPAMSALAQQAHAKLDESSVPLSGLRASASYAASNGSAASLASLYSITSGNATVASAQSESTWRSVYQGIHSASSQASTMGGESPRPCAPGPTGHLQLAEADMSSGGLKDIQQPAQEPSGTQKDASTVHAVPHLSADAAAYASAVGTLQPHQPARRACSKCSKWSEMRHCVPPLVQQLVLEEVRFTNMFTAVAAALAHLHAPHCDPRLIAAAQQQQQQPAEAHAQPAQSAGVSTSAAGTCSSSSTHTLAVTLCSGDCAAPLPPLTAEKLTVLLLLPALEDYWPIGHVQLLQEPCHSTASSHAQSVGSEGLHTASTTMQGATPPSLDSGALQSALQGKCQVTCGTGACAAGSKAVMPAGGTSSSEAHGSTTATALITAAGLREEWGSWLALTPLGLYGSSPVLREELIYLRAQMQQLQEMVMH